MTGLTIYQYQLLEPLGKGAMGDVYLAEDTRLRRKVALKLAASADIDASSRERFLDEARIAVSLHHKNIITIFDCNLTPDGQPYIVMEWIDGRSLSEALASGNLSLPQRIRIVEEIADALAEAHRRGIIHRDIKPANVLLDEKGEARVLDFGLAKHFNPAAGEVDLFAPTLGQNETLSGTVKGTPQYMSPEQARGNSADADARSDLFSLGALLYESLTGQLPFPGDTISEICGRIQFIDPPPPSTVNPQVSAELDRITLKALAKLPDDRYQTADEMLAELQAERAKMSDFDVFVARQTPADEASNRTTVEATSPATIAESLRRPPKAWVIPILALVVAAIALGWWRHWWPFNNSMHEPAPLAQQRFRDGLSALQDGAYFTASKLFNEAINADKNYPLAYARGAQALAELDNISSARGHLTQLLEIVPDQTRLPALDRRYLQAITNTVNEKFEAAVEDYQEIVRLAPNSDIAHFDLGRAYEQKGDLQKAGESYRKALQYNPQSAAAHLRLGIVLGAGNDVKGAESSFQEAETIYQRLSNIEGAASVSYQRGVLHDKRNESIEAQKHLEQALRGAQTLSNRYLECLARLQLSSVHFTEGRMVDAEREASVAEELAQNQGLENLATRSFINLGSLSLTRGKHDLAESNYKRAINFASRNQVGRNLAQARGLLAALYVQQKRNTDEAVQNAQKAIDFYRSTGNRIDEIPALRIIARAYRNKGNFNDSERTYAELVRLVSDPREKANLHFDLGRLFVYQKNFPKAISQFGQFLSLVESLKTDTTPFPPLQAGYGFGNIANAYWQLGDYENARKALDQAYEINNHLQDHDKEFEAYILWTDSRMVLSQRNFSDAEAKSRKALELVKNSESMINIEARSTLGLALALSGTINAGIKECLKAVELASKNMQDHQMLAEVRVALSQAYLEGKFFQKVLPLALQAQSDFSRIGDSESEWRAWLIAALASVSDYASSHLYAQNSSNIRLQLEQKWGREFFGRYTERPDIQVLSKQHNSLLGKR